MKYCVGNVLTSVNEGVILHGCNAQGVMGGGIAAQIKIHYPEVYLKYRDVYLYSGLSVGDCVPVKVSDTLTIWNMITQDRYGVDKVHTDYDAVRICFEKLKAAHNGEEIHHPLIGCGLGGGNWDTVSGIIVDVMDDIETTLWVLTQEEFDKYCKG